eukprot:TRINITY_DN43250_c0_g1_i1.p1 TRINITY_DN43250_c0_g1~~TRINITY_DN43250_c0_g1_i1.p1  ORF type:complete len:1254 (+),score=260.53 TRINITY_DN43250_c0_g1_i1:168-3764(+)
MALSLSLGERQFLVCLGVLAIIAAAFHEAVQLKAIGNVIQSQLLEDYYTVLNIPDTASDQEIRTAYRRATVQFQANLQDEAARIRRAKVVTAHETLTNAESREAYDGRRRLVKLVTGVLTVICVIVPIIGLLAANFRFFRFSSSTNKYGIINRSFEGKVLAAFDKVQTTVQVCVDRGTIDAKLGLRLVPNPKGGPMLQVASIAPDTVVEAHNRQARENCGTEPAWWLSKEVWVGDLLSSLNGISNPDQIKQEFGKSTMLRLALVRSPAVQALLPWIAEAELRRTSSNERWGCQMSPANDGSPTLEVIDVDADGVVARWNRLNPHLRVQTGDRIAAVNQTLGVNKMLGVMRDTTLLESRWTVLRGVLQAPSPPELTCGPFHKRDGQKLGIRIGQALAKPVRGSILETMGGDQIVVKEVVAGHMVDQWNERRSELERITEGAIVVAVNGKTDPQEFTTELGKAVVQITTRLPLGGCSALADSEKAAEAMAKRPASTANSAASTAAQRRIAEPESTLSNLTQMVQPLLPSCFKSLTFEEKVRQRLSTLRCEFNFEITREASGDKVGLQLQPVKDDVGGLEVTAVTSGSLVGQKNAELARTSSDDPGARHTPGVKVGDRLTAVNAVQSPAMMVEILQDASVQRLDFCFSRKALDAAPGLWEAQIERQSGEGWGMELQEPNDRTANGNGFLTIEGLSAGMAIDRWNKLTKSSGLWAVKPGDVIIAVEPEVAYKRMLDKLRSTNQARVMFLRWFSGPAPVRNVAGGGPAPSPSAPSSVKTNSKVDKVTGEIYEVIVEKSGPQDRLGLKLEHVAASTGSPNRTAVQAVVAGCLIDTHNTRALAAGKSETVVAVGDEVESINGETDSSRFGECTQSQRAQVVIRFRRTRGVGVPLPSQSPASGAVSSSPPIPAIPRPVVAAAPAATPPRATPPAPKPAPGVVAQVSSASPAATAAAARAVSTLAPAPANTPVAVAAAVLPPSEVATTSTVEAKSPTPAATTTTTTVEAESQPSVSRSLSASEAKEVFLLKQEITQLRRRVDAENSQEEVKKIRRERDAAQKERDALLKEQACMKAENAAMQAEVARLERSSRALQRSQTDSASVEEENSALRAQVAELRTQEQRLEHALKRSGELADANSRLASENERLTAMLAEHLGREERHNSVESTAVESDPQALQMIEEKLSQLQELSLSMVHVLSEDNLGA